MKIAVIGSGYVGLVSGACFSEFGFEGVCGDQDAGKIAQLNDGKIPIYEPELDTLVKNNVARRRLSFTTDLSAATAGVATTVRRGPAGRSPPPWATTPPRPAPCPSPPPSAPQRRAPPRPSSRSARRAAAATAMP